MNLDPTNLTGFHTLVSLIAIALGGLLMLLIALRKDPAVLHLVFFVLAVIVTGTGFLFPLPTFTPAVGVGIVSSVVLIATAASRYVLKLAGKWRTTYSICSVVNLYLLVFVLIAQTFQKIPQFHVLAPTGTEPPFAIAQGINLIVFIAIGFVIARQRN
jgi:hypothetical protein